MKGNYFPNYDLASRIDKSKYDSGLGYNMPGLRMNNVESPETGNFKQVLGGLIDNLNEEVNAPDNMLKDVMQGNKNVDIHDVMIAMSKSEISVNLATQITGKVINAYDRVMQINI